MTTPSASALSSAYPAWFSIWLAWASALANWAMAASAAPLFWS